MHAAVQLSSATSSVILLLIDVLSGNCLYAQVSMAFWILYVGILFGLCVGLIICNLKAEPETNSSPKWSKPVKVHQVLRLSSFRTFGAFGNPNLRNLHNSNPGPLGTTCNSHQSCDCNRPSSTFGTRWSTAPGQKLLLPGDLPWDILGHLGTFLLDLPLFLFFLAGSSWRLVLHFFQATFTTVGHAGPFNLDLTK